MKTIRSRIVKILQEGMLKGRLKTLEAFLLDRIFIRTQAEVQIKYNTKKNDLVKMLQNDLEQQKRLDDPASFNSYGDYLKLFLEQNKISLSNAELSYGINKQMLVGIMDNRILLTVIDPVVLAKVSKGVHLQLVSAVILIEKSLKLYLLEPSSKGAMARYSSKQGLDQKDRSMKDGVAELIMKAAERKSFNIEQQKVIDGDVAKFLDAFKQAYSLL